MGIINWNGKLWCLFSNNALKKGLKKKGNGKGGIGMPPKPNSPIPNKFSKNKAFKILTLPLTNPLGKKGS